MLRPVQVILGFLVVVSLCMFAAAYQPQERERPSRETPFRTPPDLKTVPPEQWQRIDKSVKSALTYLASRQDTDGSFPTNYSGQPAVTSLVVLAFLAAGEKPGVGEHGKRIERAIDFVLDTQREDGLFYADATDGPIPPFEGGSHTATYNHAISCLMLCEAYGATDALQRFRMQTAIERGIALARKMQLRKQHFPEDKGGFRYIQSVNLEQGIGDADLSVTGWFMMFFRSAKNAGFSIPEEFVDEANAFVRRCYDPQRKAFWYALNGTARNTPSRGVTGAGIVCLTIGGKPDEEIARAAGQWILDHPFDRYGGFLGNADRFHYGAYYCSQAMFLIGGDYWAKFYPVTAETLLVNQSPDGRWPPEQRFRDVRFGSEYTTALSVLTLSTAYQLLPIHQR